MLVVVKMFKTKMGEEMDKWLESEDNLELWHDKLSARERRILMTKWAGAGRCCLEETGQRPGFY